MKHDHHTTPRYYLKAFSIPTEPSFIWQYQRGKPYQPGHRADHHNPVKRSLKKAGVITDYYGNHEDDLATREAHANPLLERLRTSTSHGPLLTPREKERLTDYIGLLIKRTTAGEARAHTIWPKAINHVLPELERRITDLALRGEFGKAHQLSTLLAQYTSGSMPPDLRQSTITLPYDQVRKRIIDLPWTILTANHPVLITSDNPVRWPEHEGLGHPYAFLYLPVSTTRGLLAATTDASTLLALPHATTDCAPMPITPDQAATLNHLTVTGAHQYLYSHQATPDLAASFG